MMHKFQHPLTRAEDPDKGYRMALQVNATALIEPTVADGVSEEDIFQLKRLNDLLDETVDAASNDAALKVQLTLGIPSGDLASVFFSSAEVWAPLAEEFSKYILLEYKMAHPG